MDFILGIILAISQFVSGLFGSVPPTDQNVNVINQASTTAEVRSVVNVETEITERNNNDQQAATTEIKKFETTVPSKEDLKQNLENKENTEIIDTSEYFVQEGFLAEQSVNLQSIVLVRCAYKSQYFSQSSQPYDEITFGMGTGVFVSKEGHVLTAAHVVREKSLGTDQTGRTWIQDGCEIARTVDYKTEISANPKHSIGFDAEFEDVEIVFEPSDTEYLNSTGIDVAVLKLKEGSTENYTSLYSNLVAFIPGPYSITVVGYPGKYINLPQKLERFDATAYMLAFLTENEIPACKKDEYADICGWRYSIVRRYYDFREYYGYYTDLGIETETVKGGFSGSPVFFKGNLIGLLTHGKTREQLDIDNVGIWTEIDIADILTSRDIKSFLATKGFIF